MIKNNKIYCDKCGSRRNIHEILADDGSVIGHLCINCLEIEKMRYGWVRKR